MTEEREESVPEDAEMPPEHEELLNPPAPPTPPPA